MHRSLKFSSGSLVQWFLTFPTPGPPVILKIEMTWDPRPPTFKWDAWGKAKHDCDWTDQLSALAFLLETLIRTTDFSQKQFYRIIVIGRWHDHNCNLACVHGMTSTRENNFLEKFWRDSGEGLQSLSCPVISRPLESQGRDLALGWATGGWRNIYHLPMGPPMPAPTALCAWEARFALVGAISSIAEPLASPLWARVDLEIIVSKGLSMQSKQEKPYMQSL